MSSKFFGKTNGTCRKYWRNTLKLKGNNRGNRHKSNALETEGLDRSHTELAYFHVLVFQGERRGQSSSGCSLQLAVAQTESGVNRLHEGDFQKLKWERDKKEMADLETKCHGLKTTVGKSFRETGVKGLTLKSSS